LWLLCFADQHDGGYDLGHALVSEDPACDELYPKLDPEYPTFGFSTAPWGEHQDEDALEWTGFVASTCGQAPTAAGSSPVTESDGEVGKCRLRWLTQRDSFASWGQTTTLRE